MAIPEEIQGYFLQEGTVSYAWLNIYQSIS